MSKFDDIAGKSLGLYDKETDSSHAQKILLIKMALSFFGLILLLVGFLIFSNILIYIAPNEFGIKEVKLGVNRGIQKQIFSTGWHIAIPGFSRFHKFPSDVQVFDMTNRPEERLNLRVRTERAAHIQTSDGFFVDVDISILYGVVDPYKVITLIGPGQLYVDNGILPRAEAVMKQALGTLNTEEFYNSHLRMQKVQLAKEMLDLELAPKGLHVYHVLVRYFEYSPEIQKNIEEKKLKDQLVFKNQSEAKAATSEANLKKVSQEGEAKLTVKLQEGESYTVTKKAEQDLYARRQRAEADLLVKLAEAYKTELKNTALQGTGSESMVGLKMAEVFDSIELLMLPSDGEDGVNPLNLDNSVKLIGAKSK